MLLHTNGQITTRYDILKHSRRHVGDISPWIVQIAVNFQKKKVRVTMIYIQIGNR
jgi:hypothetical protein